jgi:hypothetical protein
MTTAKMSTMNDAEVSDTPGPAVRLSGAFVQDRSDVTRRDTDPGITRIDRRLLFVGLYGYAMSRVCVALGAGIAATQQTAALSPTAPADQRAADVIDRFIAGLAGWDGQFYLAIVRDGYPTTVPSEFTTAGPPEARIAFFPMYPFAVRVADVLLPGHETVAALALNFMLGGAAILLIGVFAARLRGPRAGRRSMLLIAIFPGSFVLSFAYSEALFLCLAAGCLILLHDRRWLLAGVAAAVASATRPNGLALTAAVAIAAIADYPSRPRWRPVVAVLLAPVGFVVFVTAVGWHAGDLGAWFHVQREIWDEGFSFGWSTLTSSLDAITDPLTSPTDLLSLCSLLVAGALVVVLVRERLGPAPTAYALAVLVLMLLPHTVQSRPRFVFTAFPLLVAAAVWSLRRSRPLLEFTIVGLSCAGLVATTALYTTGVAVP